MTSLFPIFLLQLVFCTKVHVYPSKCFPPKSVLFHYLGMYISGDVPEVEFIVLLFVVLKCKTKSIRYLIGMDTQNFCVSCGKYKYLVFSSAYGCLPLLDVLRIEGFSVLISFFSSEERQQEKYQ